ncbi:unnamed protein product, partial [Prunus brigantina]
QAGWQTKLGFGVCGKPRCLDLYRDSSRSSRTSLILF